MKTLLLSLFLLCSTVPVWAQPTAIVAALNNALRSEHILQRLNPTNNYKINWHQGYRIEHDWLSVRFTKTDTLTQCSCTVARTVNIRKIKAVAKDVQVVFLTKPDVVKEILTYNKCATNSNTPRTETHYSDMFFTEIRIAKNNDDLAIRLQRAFKENKLKITIPYWYD